MLRKFYDLNINEKISGSNKLINKHNPKIYINFILSRRRRRRRQKQKKIVQIFNKQQKN